MTAADLGAVAALANEFNGEVGNDPTVYSAEGLGAFVFGADAFLSIQVAIHADAVAGYATYHRGFDPFLAAPCVMLADLYVVAEMRSRGIGARLMAAAAADGLTWGATSMWWGVDDDNHRGQAFYRRFGARDIGDRLYRLEGAALLALAKRSKEASDT